MFLCPPPGQVLKDEYLDPLGISAQELAQATGLLEGRAPNVPRLEEVNKAQRKRYYLVPGKRFKIGRKSTCHLAFNDRLLQDFVDQGRMKIDAAGYV